MQWTVVIGLLFALLVGVFAIQNNIPVTLKFFSWQFETSLAVVAIGGLALGALLIGILGVVNQLKSRMKIRALNNKIKSLEKRLKELKENKEEEIKELTGKLNRKEVDLARYEGAQEEILAQEALQAKEDDSAE